MIAALVVFDVKLGPCVERLSDVSLFDEENLQTLAFAAIPEVQPISFSAVHYFRLRVREDTFLFAVSRYICEPNQESARGFSQSALVLLSESEMFIESMEHELTKAHLFDDLSITKEYPENNHINEAMFGASLRPLLPLLWSLHESVLLNKPIAVYGKDAAQVSSLVVCMTRLILPMHYYGDWRPLLTLQDKDTLVLCKSTNCIIGFCNPVILDRLNDCFLVVNLESGIVDGKVQWDKQLLDKLRMIQDDDVLGVVLVNYLHKLTMDMLDGHVPVQGLHDSLNYHMHTQ